MGALTRFVGSMAALVPERKATIGGSIPTWESGVPQLAQMAGQGAYLRFSREGYSGNDIVYACIEELATSAAEPRLACYQKQAQGAPEKITDHPLLDLFERPNPWTDRYSFIATIIMYLALAGNAYVQKERSAAGKLAALWLLRPDRVRVIPDAQRHIGGYEYWLGDHKWVLPASDIVHCRLRNPHDDYYGLPPLAVVTRRVDTDNAMRDFTRAFFANAGVPAGLLTIQKQANEAEKQLIRDRFRGEYGGPGNAGRLLVLDSTDAKYTPMGLPVGDRGLAMPDLDEISEVRIARPFGVPLELISARISMRGQRSAAKEARAGFWDETLVPLYKLLAAQLHNGLADEPGYEGYDYLEFDLEGVQALQEDADAKHKRIREDLLAGVIAQEEARKALGYAEQLPQKATWVLGSHITMTTDPLGTAPQAPLTDPNAPPPSPYKPPPDQAPDGHTSVNGHYRQLPQRLRELAATVEGAQNGNGQNGAGH